MSQEAQNAALKARLLCRIRSQAQERLDPEDEPFEGDPPEDIHFRCGCCERQGRERRAELFSYTPLPERCFKRDWPQRDSLRRSGSKHLLEGRCLQCALYFKGRLLEYDLGRRVLWARFCRETSLRVMDS